MARMHSKKLGRSKSRKPVLAEARAPEVPKEQIEELIVTYAKQGKSPATIGIMLKRDHGVQYPKHALGKTMTKVLKEKGVTSKIPYDLLDLMKKSVNMYEHLSKNRQDTYNKTRLQRVESKIWRLTKYYIRTGALPSNWRYDPKTAALIIKGTG